MKSNILTALLALVFGFVGAALWSVSGLGNQQTRDYLLANPQILPDMAQAWEKAQAAERLADAGDALQAPFRGAVLGNPNGSRTLVKFTDYGCGYCRTSVPDIARLVAGDPDLKVVVREWPIFAGSEDAARMGLAAAAQGKYDAYYHAMFELGPPSPESVEAAAQVAGLDMESARSFAASEEVTRELAQNMAYARQLGFTGTPSWVAGGTTFEGAVGFDRLAEALKQGDDEG